MISFLKKIFRVDKKTEQTDDSNANTLTLIVDEKVGYVPLIQLNINDTTDKASYEFAKALILLNGGAYASDIVDLLTELSHRNEDLNRFSTNTFILWKSQLDTLAALNNQDNSHDDPIIKPSNFAK